MSLAYLIILRYSWSELSWLSILIVNRTTPGNHRGNFCLPNLRKKWFSKKVPFIFVSPIFEIFCQKISLSRFFHFRCFLQQICHIWKICLVWRFRKKIEFFHKEAPTFFKPKKPCFCTVLKNITIFSLFRANLL